MQIYGRIYTSPFNAGRGGAKKLGRANGICWGDFLEFVVLREMIMGWEMRGRVYIGEGNGMERWGRWEGEGGGVGGGRYLSSSAVRAEGGI